MRAVWSWDELRRERPADWVFTAREAEAIRTRLASASAGSAYF